MLKNIARPMRVYRIDLAGAAEAPHLALPLPDKPSIAVLPFQNLSADPEQEYFTDGMVEDIITGPPTRDSVQCGAVGAQGTGSTPRCPCGPPLRPGGFPLAVCSPCTFRWM